MGLISPGGENLLDFLELRQVLSTDDGDLRDPLWWPQERPDPMRVARGPPRIPLLSKPGPKTLCGFVSGTIIGRVKANGYVYDDGDRVIGKTVHNAYALDDKGNYLVLVSSGGMHVRFPPEL